MSELGSEDKGEALRGVMLTLRGLRGSVLEHILSVA